MTAVKSEQEFLKSLHAATLFEPYGDWRLIELSDLDIKIEIEFFIPYIEEEKIVQFSEIAWKGMNLPLNMRGENCICCSGTRYVDCDLSFPGILIENGPNPFNLKYRMVDGKHRIEKLLSQGKTESLFRILKYEKIKPDLKKVLEQIGGNTSDYF